MLTQRLRKVISYVFTRSFIWRACMLVIPVCFIARLPGNWIISAKDPVLGPLMLDPFFRSSLFLATATVAAVLCFIGLTGINYLWQKPRRLPGRFFDQVLWFPALFLSRRLLLATSSEQWLLIQPFIRTREIAILIPDILLIGFAFVIRLIALGWLHHAGAYARQFSMRTRSQGVTVSRQSALPNSSP